MNKINGFFGAYRFLSNFYQHPIEFDGMLFPDNESAYQAAKTFDLEDRVMIRDAGSPAKAKRLGQIIEKRPDWQFVNLEIMKTINRIKFSDSRLRQKLLDTDDSILIEKNNWHDNWYGDCECKNRGGEHPNCLEVGSNWLGICLMQIRGELKDQDRGLLL